ncbi:MAG: hypothetical protein M3198_08975 [Actinomycetota bacterium]|nr:hypothetical protein [Actinomycetota bacterium]
MNKRYLSIYLNDHLAGAVAAVELAKRSANSNKGTEWGPFLERLAEDIEEDRLALLNLMSALGIRQDLLKDAAAWLGEKVGRLKLNGQLVGYSELSRLIELDGLAIGIEGKGALWRTLQRLDLEEAEAAGMDFVQLEERAKKQQEELEEYRQRAGKVALS